MYCEYYGFKEKPFNVTSDPAFFFLSRKHKDAIACMFYGIKERKGIIAITGEIGTGKTTVCRTLLSKIDKTVKTALILNPCFSELQLLELIIRDFGIQPKKKTRLDLISELNRFLIDESTRGNTAAIIIDEAQNLTPRQLEQIRLLSNLETDKEKLLQIILVGQPELQEKLELRELRQVKQRIMVNFHIEPLDRDEIKGYIKHRISVALPENNKNIEFTERAFREIYNFSAGTPRLINLTCDRALLMGFLKETNTICETIVQDCIKDINLKNEHNL